MFILGVNAGHNAGIALIHNGVFIEAIDEERFSRFKNHHGLPIKCIEYVRKKYSIEKFERVIIISANGRYVTPLFGEKDNELLRKQKGENIFFKTILYEIGILQLWRKYRYFTAYLKQPMQRVKIDTLLRKHFQHEDIEHLDHHLAHAWASLAFADKPNKGVIITLDGEGDGLCGSVNLYEKGRLRRVISIPSGVGIGTLYGKVTEFLGMRRNEHEYKIMGLAPYAKIVDGEKVLNHLRSLITYDQNRMKFESTFNMQYAKYYFIRNNFYNYRFDSIAYGIQKFTEEIVLKFFISVVSNFKPEHLYFGGGIFMNIKLNQKIRESAVLDDVFFTPSCGDDSLAIGAAKYGHDDRTGSFSSPIISLYLGTDYCDEEICEELKKLDRDQFDIKSFKNSDTAIEHEVAKLLSLNKIVARFKGRMEWGSRALGNRSILANPSDQHAVRKINEAIKNRDFWMPFAPTILSEHASSIISNKTNSPYMTIGFDIKEDFRERMGACIHPYDFTCRPQILHKEHNEEYYDLVEYFHEITGIAAVLNTSFNLHGSPIVESPHNAIETLVKSGLEFLAIGNYLVSKKKL